MNSLNTETSQPMSSDILFASNLEKSRRAFRITAGVLVIIYICVQAFQNYVFGAFAAPANTGEQL